VTNATMTPAMREYEAAAKQFENARGQAERDAARARWDAAKFGLDRELDIRQEAASFLAYLWEATGKNPDIRVCDLFDENDPIRADVERYIRVAKETNRG
jgi:hypothetical protein